MRVGGNPFRKVVFLAAFGDAGAAGEDRAGGVWDS